jgi:hypothetical protein
MRRRAPAGKPIFALGQIVATPAVIEATNPWQRKIYLRRHVSGDFGCVCPEDAETNREAIRDGFRILSAYPVDPCKPSKGFGDNTLWAFSFTKGPFPMTKTLLNSPLDVAEQLTPSWMRRIREFDALEINPCQIIEILQNGTEVVEPCDPAQADFWTVYGHFVTGGVDAFEDFGTEAEAVQFRDRLLAAYPHLGG